MPAESMPSLSPMNIQTYPGVDVLARKLEIPVYATEGTLADFLFFRRTSKKPLTHYTCRDHEQFASVDFEIVPFSTSTMANEPAVSS